MKKATAQRVAALPARAPRQESTEDIEAFDPIVNHYIPRALIMQSLIEGTPAKALCGASDVVRPRADGQVTASTNGVVVICPLCGHIFDQLRATADGKPSEVRTKG